MSQNQLPLRRLSHGPPFLLQQPLRPGQLALRGHHPFVPHHLELLTMPDMEEVESMVTGIGDEVVLASTLLLAALCALAFWIWMKPRDNETPHRPVPAGRIRANVADCPICLDEVSLAVETNCGHVFCGHCFFLHQSHVQPSWLNEMRCGLCRQRVTMLMPYFSQSETSCQQPDRVQARDRICQQISDFNRRFSDSDRTLMEQIQDVPMLLRHLGRRFWSADSLTFMFRLRILVLVAVSLLYILSPFDIIPEGLFGAVGFLDDLLLLLIILVHITSIFRTTVGQEGLL